MGSPFPNTTPWSRQHTIDLLALSPLPADFLWPQNGEGVRPVAPLDPVPRGSYGQWLAGTPRFPGLFDPIHDILVDLDTPDVELSTWIATPRFAEGHLADSYGDFLSTELNSLRATHCGADAPMIRQLRRRPAAHHSQANTLNRIPKP